MLIPFTAKILMQACRYREIKIHQHNAVHMTRVAPMPIYDKNTLKSSQGTTGLILMKLCMKQEIPKPIIFCSSYGLGMTLTYFMAGSNFAI